MGSYIAQIRSNFGKLGYPTMSLSKDDSMRYAGPSVRGLLEI